MRLNLAKNKKCFWHLSITSKINLMITQLVFLILAHWSSTVYQYVWMPILTIWSKEQLWIFLEDILNWVMESLEEDRELFYLKKCYCCYKESNIVWLTESISIFLISPILKDILQLILKRKNINFKYWNRLCAISWLQMMKKNLKMFYWFYKLWSGIIHL